MECKASQTAPAYLESKGLFWRTDNRIGQQTKLAVMPFQQDYGLVVDGIAGPITLVESLAQGY